MKLSIKHSKFQIFKRNINKQQSPAPPALALRSLASAPLACVIFVTVICGKLKILLDLCSVVAVGNLIIMAEFKTPVKSNKPFHGAGGEQITIPPSPFLNRLGYGTGVSVMQLIRSPRAGQIRSPWALKMLNKRVKPNKVYTERLKAEADLLQRMSHPNIVGFRAFSGDKILYLGMEACDVSLGDMIERRVEESGEPFTQRQMLKMVSDIASALDYLHFKMQILHGDMKSYNVLVNGDFVICKLCDFGVTLPLDENGVFDQEGSERVAYFGTEAWSAPEVIHGGEISHKTDIWPLGLTVWEMMALMPLHSQDDTVDVDDSVVCLDDTVESDGGYFSERYGTRPAIPAYIPAARYAAALALHACCTEPAPARRPAAHNLALVAADMLDKCIKAENLQTPAPPSVNETRI